MKNGLNTGLKKVNQIWISLFALVTKWFTCWNILPMTITDLTPAVGSGDLVFSNHIQQCSVSYFSMYDFQVHFKFIVKCIVIITKESYSNHNSLFQLKCALIFSFLAIITLTPEGNFCVKLKVAWNSACGKGCVRLTKYKLTTTIENVHIFTNFHCKCKRLSTFPVHFIPLRIFLKSTLEVLTWFPENIRS